MTVGPGKTLSHFKILAKIGEGGMGVVYRAEDEKLRRPVALKVLPPDLVANEERRLRFLREARTAAAINHPNIAHVYEVDEADGVVFIAMELVEGKTLREVMGGKPMSIKDTLRIATEMSEGLAKAHQSNVIHRDLKPENVIVTTDGHVKILDFGLAKLLHEHSAESAAELSKLSTISEELTIQGKIFGTVAYMSPEQARGQTVDARSDLFSFGTTLYEMVTGKVPFHGKTATDTLSSIIRDQLPPPSQFNDTAPQELDRIVAGCLEKDPRDRYQHTVQLAVDLRKLKRTTDSGVQAVRTPSGPVAAPPIGGRRVLRWVKRHPFLTVTLGLALVVAVVGAWWSTRGAGGFKSGDRFIVADFDNRTGRPDYGIQVRDAFAGMLAGSKFIDVVLGERLEDLLLEFGAGRASRIDRAIAERICNAGGCTGFLTGGLSRDGDAFKLQVEVFRTGGTDPLVVRSSLAPSEDDLLAVIHEMVLNIRQMLGEAPHIVATSEPPTTRSLAAYQAFASTLGIEGDPDRLLALFRRATEIDPNFAQAQGRIRDSYWTLGEFSRWRQAAEEVYRVRDRLPERVRFDATHHFLSSSYDFAAAFENAITYAELYRLEPGGYNFKCMLYNKAYEDLQAAENYCRAAYELSPGIHGLVNLSTFLMLQGKAEEIERLVSQFRPHGKGGIMTKVILLWADMIRGNEARIREAVEGLSSESIQYKMIATNHLLAWLLASGRLTEARSVAPAARRTAGESRNSNSVYLSHLRQVWIEMRHSGRASEPRHEALKPARENLTYLPVFAAFSVETGLQEPLAQLIQQHALAEKGSQSQYVHEELQFARGCLALLHGDIQGARNTLEPLARNSNLTRRHRMLSLAYERLGLLRDAAHELEQVLMNPHFKWGEVYDFIIPAVQVLEQYRLAHIYDKLDDTARARHWYERFTDDWKDADPDIPELIEARERLGELDERPVTSGH